MAELLAQYQIFLFLRLKMDGGFEHSSTSKQKDEIKFKSLCKKGWKRLSPLDIRSDTDAVPLCWVKTLLFLLIRVASHNWKVSVAKCAFHWKNSGLNFRKFPVTNETAFSGISGKGNNLIPLRNIRNFWLNGKHPKCDLKGCKMKINFLVSFCSAYEKTILEF